MAGITTRFVKYRFSPFEKERTIRLVTIAPGGFDDPIHLDIQLRDLDQDEPKYVALSYVWGTSADLRVVHLSKIPFSVKPILFDALRRLRLLDQPRTLWIDAICINQEDIAERNSQVPLMGLIYSRASSTVIWAGESDVGGDVAKAFWCFELLCGLYEFWYHTPAAATQRGLRSRLLKFDLQPIFRFFRRDWFKRAWTFQEICLSLHAEVLCGHHSIEWSRIVFAIAAARIGGDGGALAGISESALTRIDYWALVHIVGESKARGRRSLTTLLSETRGLATTDARDRVYSLMGIAHVKIDAFRPDYSAAVASTFIRATRLLIAKDNNLEIFQQLDKPRAVDDLPSWVPDWRQKQRGSSFVPSKVSAWLPDKKKSKKVKASTADGTSNFYTFNRSYTPEFTDRAISDKPALYLNGACFDVIERTNSTLTLLEILNVLSGKQQVNWCEIFAVVRNFCDELALPEKDRHTHEPTNIAMLRTLCADRVPIEKQREASQDLIADQIGHYKRKTGLALLSSYRGTFVLDQSWIRTKYTTMWHECYEEPPTPTVFDSFAKKTSKIAKMVIGIHIDEAEDELRTRVAREYCSMLCRILEGRLLIITHNNYIGLAPDTCKPGDQIFSLLGGKVPYVLRPARERDEYQILGEAYIHGTMDGELWREVADGQVLEPHGTDIHFGDVTLI